MRDRIGALRRFFRLVNRCAEVSGRRFTSVATIATIEYTSCCDWRCRIR